MGFFPLPETEARKVRSLLSFPFPCSVIDPCAGQGTAFNLITEGATVERHGIELDTRRAEQATASGIHTTQGNVFDSYAKVESFSLLYLILLCY
jgi:tRNA1(Val) A37 N6-methylase TrmN6